MDVYRLATGEDVLNKRISK